jgi:long-chain acyl-CoA synthetase
VNCEEWVTTDLAANLLGITTVPLYETLGAAMMQLMLEQTQMSTIFGSDKCLMNIISLAAQQESIANTQGQQPGELRYLENLVVFGIPSEALVEVCKQYGIMLWEYGALIEEQVRSQGDSFEIIDHSQTRRDDIFTISYTSGTENNPKGVMLSNENFISAIANILKVAGDFPFRQDDVYISYLPLAHVFDRLGVYGVISIGAQVGFFGG